MRRKNREKRKERSSITRVWMIKNTNISTKIYLQLLRYKRWVWRWTEKRSYVGDAGEEQREEEGEEQHYQSLNDEEYEHICENLPSASEVQTLSVEVN